MRNPHRSLGVLGNPVDGSFGNAGRGHKLPSFHVTEVVLRSHPDPSPAILEQGRRAGLPDAGYTSFVDSIHRGRCTGPHTPIASSQDRRRSSSHPIVARIERARHRSKAIQSLRRRCPYISLAILEKSQDVVARQSVHRSEGIDTIYAKMNPPGVSGRDPEASSSIAKRLGEYPTRRPFGELHRAQGRSQRPRSRGLHLDREAPW